MKTFIYLLLFWCNYAVLQAQTNIELVANLPYDIGLNDIWGYVADDGTEYALVGTIEGVSIVSLADPTNPTEVAFATGSSSGWRDIKTWGKHAYVTTEAKAGLMVIDLSMLPDTISHYNWQPTLEGGVDSLTSCHNLYIDEHGYCYLAGSKLNDGGLLIVDVFSEPGQPKLVGKGNNTYAHDVYARRNRAYSSEIYEGELAIYDVSDKTNIQLLATQPTPFNFTHNAWLSDDGNTVFTADERKNAPITAFDVSNLQDIKELGKFVPQATKDKGVIAHNVHVLNDYLVISHYGNGVVIVDAHRPENLVEVGNFDTSPQGLSGFVGAWGAYPFLPSGLVLVSDRQNGLFVVRPDYKRAAYLEGSIKDANTNGVLSDVTIVINGTPITTTSTLTGTYTTGTVETGTYEVTISKPKYIPQTALVTLTSGELTKLDIDLKPAAIFGFSGTVRTNDENGTPLGAVKIKLSGGNLEWETTTDESGNFIIDTIYEGTYKIIVGKWGYKQQLLENLNFNETNNSITVNLEEGLEDSFVLDLGWIVGGDDRPFFDATFELGVPIQAHELGIFNNLLETGIFTSSQKSAVINEDVAGDIGESCYITGNAIDYHDTFVYFDYITLSSPRFDLKGMTTPTIGYFTNFFNAFSPTGRDAIIEQGKDTLYVYLSNGSRKVLIEKITSDFDPVTFALSQWRPSTIKVSDFLTPTNSMRLHFEVNPIWYFTALDEIKKIGVDYFRAWDAQTVRNRDIHQEQLTFAAFPNPFTQQIRIQYDQSEWTKRPTVIVSDALGRIVLQQAVPSNQIISMPTSMQEGIYFIHLREVEKSSQVLKLVKLKE